MTRFSLLHEDGMRIGRHALAYGVSSVLGRMANFLLVPLYTAALPNPARYGIVSEWYSYVALCNIVYLYGMETTYFRHAHKDNLGEHRVFSQILGMIFLSGIMFSVLLWTLSEPLATAMRYPGQAHYLRWFALIMLADALAAIPLAKLRLSQASMRFAAIKMQHIALYMGLNIFFLFVCPAAMRSATPWATVVGAFYRADWDVEYIFLSNLIASLLLLFLLRREFLSYRPFLRKSLTVQLLRYTLPLMIMAFGLAAVDMLPRIMYKHIVLSQHGLSDHLRPLHDLGVYGACAKLGVLMLLLMQALRYAADPIMLAEKEHPVTRSRLAEWLLIVVSLGSFVFVAISLQPRVLSFLFLRNPLYREGIDIVPILLLGYLFFGVYQHLSVWFKRTHRTMHGVYFSLFAIIFVVLGSWLLVPLMAYRAMAWSVLIAYCLMACLCYAVGRRYYVVRYPTWRVLRMLLLSTFLVTGWYFFVRERLDVAVEFLTSLVITAGYGLWVWKTEGMRLRGLFGP